jgi:predicted Zn-dependent protease with MMP-like domain
MLRVTDDGQADFDDRRTDFDDQQAAFDDRQAAFDELITRAIASIPEPFASRLGTVAIVVDDEATAEQLASVGAHGLFGLYQGVPRTVYGADSASVPSKITIFRRPLEAVHRDPAALARAVEETVLHEIAHHFGISDARLRELQRERRP